MYAFLSNNLLFFLFVVAFFLLAFVRWFFFARLCACVYVSLFVCCSLQLLVLLVFSPFL